jgi:hypothetical protein
MVKNTFLVHQAPFTLKKYIFSFCFDIVTRMKITLDISMIVYIARLTQYIFHNFILVKY